MEIIIPATSANLGPGFDTLGLGLGLFNHVLINESKIFSILVEGENDGKSAIFKNNIFVTIFNDVFKRLSGTKKTFKFKFKNNIPFSRGLGSSSAVIVGAIAAAYEMSGFKLQKQTILNEALFYENHPDNIAPATYGGFCVNIVENNKVITKRTEISDEICAVVVIPNKPMSTEKSRDILPKNILLANAVYNISRSAFITSCFFTKDYDALKLGAKDAIHEDIRMANLPELFDVRKTAYENGAIFSTLSGSGSSFLNIVYKDDAKRLQSVLKGKFLEFGVEIFEFNNSGFEVIS